MILRSWSNVYAVCWIMIGVDGSVLLAYLSQSSNIHHSMSQLISIKPNLDPDSLRQNLPDGPGVYLFKDRSDRVIYVGKAKSIKKRLLSYFKPPTDLPHKTAIMMKKAQGLDYILTATEKEAFILERNLIKKHMPRYNIVLRDDKQYPCLRLDIKELYPRLGIVRKIKKDGALYFGPFSSANSVRCTLKLIDSIFQLRKCKGKRLPNRSRPCLNHQLGRCLGACVNNVSPSSYKEIVDQVKLFLEGRNRELISKLKRKMQRASDQLDFEKAAQIRDQIRAVENTIERQNVVSPKMEDQDIIGLAQKNGLFHLIILFVRRGNLMGSQDYLFKNEGGSATEVMEAFLKQYYTRELFIPKQILISEPVEDLLSITEWISEQAGRKVSIHRPLRGVKRRLVKLAVANAENLMAHPRYSEGVDLMSMSKAVLNLKKVPIVIEGLDISNLYGDKAVGTIVSFVDGIPNRSGYRNYRIKGVDSIDDYGMMAELASRRLSKDKPPDLFVVDGGKGHLLAVKKVLDDVSKADRPDVVAIAKAEDKRGDRTDKVYIVNRKNPLSLPGDHPVLHLLMRIRDEAHRRAITYHRKIRGKSLKDSELDRIPGVGSKRKKILLKHFGNIEAISRVEMADLVQIPGISQSLAQNIYNFFHADMEAFKENISSEAPPPTNR